MREDCASCEAKNAIWRLRARSECNSTPIKFAATAQIEIRGPATEAAAKIRNAKASIATIHRIESRDGARSWTWRPVNRLDRCRERVQSEIDGALREREGDPLNEELVAAMKRIGKLTIDNEVVRGACRPFSPAEIPVMAAAIAHGAGRACDVADVCDRFGVARSSFYAWRWQQERPVCCRPRRCRIYLGDVGLRGSNE